MNSHIIKHPVSALKALAIFLGATLWFFILLFTLFPYLKAHYAWNPALYWFITGYFLFVPLFIYTIWSVRSEGAKSRKEILLALHVKTLTKKDWLYTIVGIVLAFVFTGLVFGASAFLNKQFGTPLLNAEPWFIEMHPFVGTERLLLLVWLPMFFFNIAGEELLWRGYIQARMPHKYSWLLNSVLWMCFHLPFGFDLMIMLLPVFLLFPYIFHKTKNTSVLILIHTIYNGPIFVLIALGLH